MKALLAACVLGTLAAGSAMASDDRVALFKNVSGSITVVRSGGDVAAAAGMPLHRADKVVTQPGASAGIVFTSAISRPSR